MQCNILFTLHQNALRWLRQPSEPNLEQYCWTKSEKFNNFCVSMLILGMMANFVQSANFCTQNRRILTSLTITRWRCLNAAGKATELLLFFEAATNPVIRWQQESDAHCYMQCLSNYLFISLLSIVFLSSLLVGLIALMCWWWDDDADLVMGRVTCWKWLLIQPRRQSYAWWSFLLPCCCWCVLVASLPKWMPGDTLLVSHLRFCWSLWYFSSIVLHMW